MNRLELPDDQPRPMPEITDRLDEVVVRIPCYEPASDQVLLTGRTLCNHGILVGASGSGKTSILRWYLKSFIHHRADDPGQRPGLFVFDLNADDTVPLVAKWAREAGREDDLRILSGDEGHLDLFAAVQRLDQLSAATAQLMHGPWASLQGDNAYWTETTRILLDAGLTVCFAVEGALRLETVRRFLQDWLVSKQLSVDDETLLAGFTQLGRRLSECSDKTVVAKLEMARATLEMWAKLDTRTKGILTSLFVDALAPLAATETARYLNIRRPPKFDPEELPLGRIMVFSLPAALHTESASLLGKTIKARLWTALQQRPQDRHQRLCGVLADEYHYLASGGHGRSSDVTALATLRSRSVAVVFASQSLDHLANVMGPANFGALMPNFGSHFFFRSAEPHTGALATAIMGSREVYPKDWEDRGVLVIDGSTPPPSELVCPTGALARLEPCQAYVSVAGSERSPGLLWLGANHESAPLRPARPETSSPDDALRSLRTTVFPPVVPQKAPVPPSPGESPFTTGASSPRLHYDEATWRRLLVHRRFQRSPYPSFRAFCQAFANLGQTPQGLETLPPCWWGAVVRLTAAFFPKHPMKLLGLGQTEGCIYVTLSGTVGPTEVYLDWIETVEKSLYPIRTRRLKVRDLPLAEEMLEEESAPSDFEDDRPF
jgi:hypothetical protein